MLLTNPYYSILYEYITENKNNFNNSNDKCDYKSYDKAKDNFIFFYIFDLKKVVESNKIIESNNNYEGSLEFSYNKATNEVYVTKVPFILIFNVKIPLFTSDIVQIIIDKLCHYAPNDKLKISFADKVLPLAIDEKAIELLPTLKNTSNYRFLIYIINKITEEKKKIMTKTKRFQESQAKIERSRERAIAKKRRIMGLDPEDFASVEDFRKELKAKIIEVCQYKLKKAERHLQENIERYKEYIFKGDKAGFEYMLRIKLIDELKYEEGFNKYCYDDSIYSFYRPKYTAKKLEKILSEVEDLSPELQELISLWEYFNKTEDENLNLDFIKKATDIILNMDLYSPIGIRHAILNKPTNDDLKSFAKHEELHFLNYCPYINQKIILQNYKYAEMHPVYRFYYSEVKKLCYEYNNNDFDVAQAMKKRGLNVIPMEIIIQIEKLKKQKRYYENILSYPSSVLSEFFRISKIWGSIMHLPYWSRIYIDPTNDRKTGKHESFGLIMIHPGVKTIDYMNIINFLDNPKFKNKKNQFNYTDNILCDRLIITIPKTLSYEQIVELIKYAYKYGKKLNFICENGDIALFVKKVLLQNALNSYYKGTNYFKDWCFVNVDPIYYKTFIADTPNNKTLWHKYNYSSDYIYRRKEILSFDKMVELAINYSLVGPQSIDYQLLEALLFGSYDSDVTFLEDIKNFKNIVSLETKDIEEEFAHNKEVKRLRNELAKYYNVEKDEIVKNLSLDEIFYLVYLMKKLYFSDKNIEKVLYQIECKYSWIPIVAYVRLYEKYKSLVDDENILHELEKYFQNMFICDDEEYLKNKRRFVDVFSDLSYHLPRGYDYEFSNARKLKK